MSFPYGPVLGRPFFAYYQEKNFSDLFEYQSWMRTVKGLKPNTVNRRVKSLKSWLTWCVNEGLAPRLPDFPKGVPEASQAPRALERAEVNRLLREVERE